MTPKQIDQAEAAGIISASQARVMRAKTNPTAPVIGDEDELRFLRSFGDVFIGLGLVLLGLGAAAIAGMLGGGPIFLGAALAAYIMAEYFGRRKRAHFPTLICALAFLVFVQKGLASFAVLGGIGAAGITVLAMAAFYWRIRLPFCIALIAVALLYLLLAVLGQFAPELLQNNIGVVLVAAGLAIFAVALLYDVQDRHRTTRFADNAFWLHLLAAPLIIHGLVGEAVFAKAEWLFDVFPLLSFSERDAALVLIATVVITVIGLAINRRALIVSSLFYTALALAFLIRQTGTGFGTTTALTLLALGAMIVLLGVAWHPVRGQLIRILPRWRIFPPRFEPDFKG